MFANTTNRNLSWAVLVFGVLSVGASAAKAQEWLSDRARAEGRGVRFNGLVLHPGIGVEGGYDTNVFYADRSTEPSALLRVTPHLFLSTDDRENRDEEGPQPVAILDAGASGSFYYYFATEADPALDANAQFRLQLLPKRPFSLVVHDTFGRGSRPFVDGATSAPPTYARDRNAAGLDFMVSSRGEILSGRLGYEFGLDYFEGEEFRYANSFTHTVPMSLSWKFLPRTAIVYDARLDMQNYPNADDSLGAALHDNIRFSNAIRLNGAVTRAVSGTIGVGYAAGFYEGSAEDYDSVTGTASLRWRPNPTQRFTLGYDRSFNTSLIGNYYSSDRLGLTYEVMIAGVFLLGASASVSYLDYGVPVATGDLTLLGTSDDDGDRQDIRLDGTLFGEYRATEWLGLSATFSYAGNFTDFEYVVDSADGAGTTEPAEYQKVAVWAGVRLFY